MQSRSQNRHFILLREKAFDKMGYEYYIGKLYHQESIHTYLDKKGKVKIKNQPLKTLNDKIIRVLELGYEKYKGYNDKKTGKCCCIPTGKYEVVEDKTGKYKHYKLPNVAHRSNIEIHSGNFLKDTQGCLLVGIDYNPVFNTISESKKTCEELKGYFGKKCELSIFDSIGDIHNSNKSGIFKNNNNLEIEKRQCKATII